MKRLLAIATALLLVCSGANAQNVIERLGNRAKNAAENAIGNKIENAVNKAVDKVGKKAGEAKEERQSNSKSNNSRSNSRSESAAEVDGWTCPECGATGNTGNFCDDCGAKKPDGSAATTAAAGAPQKQPASAIVWNNYDFVAGDQIIFDDNLETEQMGEFPSQMDLFRGNVQIVSVDGIKCINSEDGIFTPFFKEPYLTDECTIEFDIYMYDHGTYEKNHPDIGVGINNYSIALATSDDFYEYDGNSKGIFIEISACEEFAAYNEPVHINYAWDVPNGDRREGSFNYELKDGYNAFHHVAISFNKRACKIYFDEQRVANIPNAVAPKWVQFRGSYDYPGLYFWKNFRIAKGAVPLYDRLQNEGKIVTYGITFDTGKATIKSESMGEINRIKGIMDQDPSIKFEVQGHCDNTGSAAVNDKLSQERAEAIVAKLAELGIAKDRLTAVGKGSSVPIADNSTDEGRAKNRRVEFIKK